MAGTTRNVVSFSISEVVKIISDGSDYESISEIGKRYPYILKLVASISAKAGNDFVELMSYIPDSITATKVHRLIKSIKETGATDETDTPEADDVNPKKRGKKSDKSESKPKAVEPDEDDDDDIFTDSDDEDEDTESESDSVDDDEYTGKTAMELYKMCKKRKIKVEAKKPAEYYADLLRKDDMPFSEDDETESEKADDEDDDWDI